VAVLLLVNTVSVQQQAAPATGRSNLAVDGEQLHVTQDGPDAVPALVLIHGFSAPGRAWAQVVPALARTHRAIRVDLLGHGSAAKPAGGDYAIAAQGRRVGAVLDIRGGGGAVVVGHSTGGSVATALAEQRRDLVGGL